MDGTLFDTEKVFYRAYEAALADQGLSLQEAYYHVNFAGTSNQSIEECLTRKHGDEFDVREYRDAWRENLDERITTDGLPIRPEIPELLDRLEQMETPLAVASSSDVAEIRHLLSTSNTQDYFSVVAGGDEVANSKPAPDVFLLAAERLSIPPENCLAIEDSNPGVLSASTAGMQVIMTPGPAGANETSRALASLPESLLEFTVEQLGNG